jgi:predicted O-methyltransferase YrrM
MTNYARLADDVFHAVPGLLDMDELAWLIEAAQNRRVVVEIGTWYGRSAKALTLGGGTVYTVDSWTGLSTERETDPTDNPPNVVRNEFFRRLQPDIEAGRVVPVWADSVEAAGRLNRLRVDMLFLDGLHTYEQVSADLAAWLPLVKVGGLVCGHDWDREDVRRAALEVLPHAEKQVGGLWSATKRRMRAKG